MASAPKNAFPKLHNAIWSGLVGKQPGTADPPIGLDRMLDLTAAAEVNGVRFDGVDLVLFAPHLDADASDEDLKQLAEKVKTRNLVVGMLAAPVWPPTGGSAMGDESERKKFLDQVRKSCRIAKRLKELGVRPDGVVRIDSACNPGSWSKDPKGNTAKIAQTFRQACDIAQDHGEKLAAEGEIGWGGMHSWKRTVELLEAVDRKDVLGFQADMAHALQYALGYNAPEDRLLPENWNWSDPEKLDQALATMSKALRPWTIALDVAQSKAWWLAPIDSYRERYCLPNDPQGALDIQKHVRHWMRNEDGSLCKAFNHIRWDGCLLPNAVLESPKTWNEILATMILVRDAHGWS
jgi:sugar phosphate isomerase/epimerase